MSAGLPSILGYLSSLLNPSPQPQPSQPVPQQPQGSTSTSPAAAPPSGGFMQGASNFLGNPLTQAALSGYFNAIGQPKSLGPLAKVSAGGLGALGGYNQALKTQQEQAAAALEAQKEQIVLQEAQSKQSGIKALPLGMQPYVQAGVPDLYKQSQNIEQNKQAVAQFQAMYPNNKDAAAFSGSYLTQTDKAVTANDIDKDYQEHLQAPGKLTAQTQDIAEKKASIAEKEAQTQRLKNAPAAGMTANWYDPATKQFYRGAQKKPTDVPASVATSAKAENEIKARAAAWQKSYQDAAKNYITTHTTTSFMGNKTPPPETEVDAYAKAQADSQVNALFGSAGTPAAIAAASGAGADEASTGAEDPLSLIPAGATPAMKGDVHGYVDADGTFHSVE